MSDLTARAPTTGVLIDATNRGRWSLLEGQAAVAAWQASGMSQRTWCRQSGVSDKRLSYWKSMVAEMASPAAESPAPPAGFVAVVPADHRCRCLRVSVGSVTVEVPPVFDAAHLRAVVEALS